MSFDNHSDKPGSCGIELQASRGVDLACMPMAAVASASHTDAVLSPRRRSSIAFLKQRWNTTYNNNLKFAVLGASAVVTCAVPAILGWNTTFTSGLKKRGVVTFSNMIVPQGWSCLTCVFVLAPTLGEVLRNSSQAITGILLVFLNNALLMPFLLSFVVKSRLCVVTMCWVDYIFFIVFILVFDFGPKTRLYALHYNTTWTMMLLNPDTAQKWITDANDGFFFPKVGLACLFRTFGGCAMAALTACILTNPFKSVVMAEAAVMKWATDAADLCRAAWCLAAKRELAEVQSFGSGHVEMRDEIDAWLTKMASFSITVAKAQSQLDCLWWVCFDNRMLRLHAALNSAQSHAKPVQDALDVLGYQVRQILQAAAASTGDSGRAVSTQRVSHFQNIIPQLLTLCERVLNVSIQGRLQSARAGALRYEVGEFSRAQLLELQGQAEALRAVRQQLLSNACQDNVAHLSLFVALGLEAYARAVLQAAEARPKFDPVRTNWEGVVPEATGGSINFVVRNTANIVAGALFGVFRLEYDATIATNIGWLTSKFLGSAIRKDLQRVLGICLPFVVGGAAYANFGDCSPEGKFKLASLLWLWSCIFLYLMIASKEFAYVALLSGAFAPIYMCRLCNKHLHDTGEVEKNHIGVYRSLRGVVFAVIIMLCGDILLKPQSLRALAAHKILEIWMGLRTEAEAVLGSEVGTSGRREASSASTNGSGVLQEHAGQQQPAQPLVTHLVSYFGTKKLLPRARAGPIGAGVSEVSNVRGLFAAARSLCAEAALQPYMRYAPFPSEAAEEVLASLECFGHDLTMLNAVQSEESMAPHRQSMATALIATDRALRETFMPLAAIEASFVSTVRWLLGSGGRQSKMQRLRSEFRTPSAELRILATNGAHTLHCGRATGEIASCASGGHGYSGGQQLKQEASVGLVIRLLHNVDDRLWNVRRTLVRHGLASAGTFDCNL